mmetsp:Transcript_26940/g.67606  ORF Transcript_26940/g.67606 Transcript_26940/m.67606 type:complete len:128 (+) Transcript_26940:494-877(+)
MKALTAAMPPVDLTASVSATMDRCAQCQRGGMKLAGCAGCQGVGPRYCSKDCQKIAWGQIHKYTCKASKNRMERGTKLRLKGLEGAKQHNGKTGVVDRVEDEKGRICVLLDGGGQLSVRPQNVERAD